MRNDCALRLSVNGFTLVELMIALAIFGIASAAIYATYQSQQNSYIVQEDVTDMQQNLRAGMFFLKRDIKMAGYNPTEKAEADNNTNNIARVAELRFARDDNEDGVIQNNEFVRYALTSDGSNGINDTSRDGVANNYPCRLGRETGIPPNNGGLQPVADHVDAIEFLYHLEDGTVTTTPASPEDIRTVKISLLVKTADTVKGFTDTAMYFPASNPTHDPTGKKWGPFNDHFQRKLLIAQVRCRNLGLK